MADKASIVGTNDKGQFTISAPRSSIDRVDVIDVDLVLHTKGGERLILPGAALEAMTAAPPTIQFSDGTMGADGLLSSVDRVQTPPTSIPAMTSLTEFDQKKTEGKKNRTDDGKDKADEAAQQAQAQQVAPLQSEGHESSIDRLIAKADTMEAELRKGIFTSTPPEVYKPLAQPSDAPGSQPQTSKIPLYMTLSEGNVVGPQTVGAKVYGAGGPSGSSIADGILTGDAAQYGRETLSGGAGADIFFADAFAKSTGTWNTTSAAVLNETAYASLDKETGLAPSGTAFYYAKEVALNVAGYIRRIDSVTINGLPAGISIQGATGTSGGSWSLTSSDVVPTAKTLVLVYDVTTIRTLFNKDSDGDGVNDYVDIQMSVTITGMGTEPLNVTKTFVLRFQDADNTTDVTNNSPVYVAGSGWSDIYVMEMASAPHTIVTFNGTYNNAQTLAQNAAASAATVDGNNTVYAGNSNDTILAGAGNDTIYAYAGDDAISAGNGDNVVWAGDGSDTIITGTGDDLIYAGRGGDPVKDTIGNTVTDAGGNNTITVLTTKTVNGSTVSGNGKDVVTITGDGDNTITVGDETDIYADGNDTVTTANGIDTINVGDGNNKVTTGNGKKAVTAGDGNDTITTGSGNDTITAGSGDNIIAADAGNNLITAGSGIDTVTTGAGNDDISVGDGARNIVWAGDGANTITAGSGDDTLVGGAGVDSIVAGAGADWIYGGTGANITLDGGAGTDWLSFNGIGSSVTGGTTTLSNWLTNAGTITGVTLTTVDTNGIGTLTHTGAGTETDAIGNIENFIGSQGDDTLNLLGYTTASHILYGLAGDDTLTGSSMDDTLFGGAGNDTLIGDAGNDTIYTAVTGDETTDASEVGSDQVTTVLSYTGTSGILITDIVNVVNAGAGADTVIGGNGNDYFIQGSNQYGDGTSLDTFAGGDGTDTLDFGGFTSALVIERGNGQAKMGGNVITTFSEVEQFILGSANDQYVGTSGNDIVYGNNGDDTFTSNGGNDSFYGGASTNNTNAGDRFYSSNSSTTTTVMDGGAGYNYYQLNSGKDIVIGGADTDRIDYSNTNSTVIVNLSNSDLTLQYWNGTAFSGTTYAVDAASGARSNATGDLYRAVGDATESKIEQIWGSGAADILVGNSLNNYISTGGNAVNDVVYGLGGNDTIDYSGGSDYIDGGGAYAGGGGAGTAVAMTASGVTGGDTVNVNGWNSSFTVTLVADGTTTGGGALQTGTIVYGTTTTTIIGIENFIGGNLADTIYGTSDGNYLYGGAGNDTIYGYGGDDVINLGGNNYGSANSGADYADADTGNDWVSYQSLSNAGVEIHLEIGQVAGWTQYSKVQIDTSTAEYDNMRGFENAQGSNQADIIHGSSVDNILWGMNGNDTLWGYDGADTLDGGSGNDSMYGGTGNDTYYVDSGSDYISEASGEGSDIVYTSVNFNLGSNGANVETLIATGTANLTLTGNTLANAITGSTGNDTLVGGGGGDALDGGSGNDMAYYYASTTGVTVNLGAATASGGDAAGDTLTSIENLGGSNVAGDVLTGNGSANTLYGYGGDDVLEGGGGNDVLDGGGGYDTLSYASSGSGVTVSLAANTASGGDAQGDTISNFERLRGSASGDTLTGSNNVNNILYGGDGDDTLIGTSSSGGGNYDTLYGDTGSDTISLTVAQLATTYVYGGSGNAAGNATETGSDTLYISNGNNLTALNGNLIHSIEVIDLANGSAQDVSAFQAQGSTANARTLINNILDNAGSTTLELYLDNNDRFHTGYSDGNGAGSYATGSDSQTTYTYGTSSITVHWGSG